MSSSSLESLREAMQPTWSRNGAGNCTRAGQAESRQLARRVGACRDRRSGLRAGVADQPGMSKKPAA